MEFRIRPRQPAEHRDRQNGEAGAQLSSGFTVLPIPMFSWLSRPDPEFHINAAATGAIIIIVTLLMNGTAIWLRYRMRKNVKW